MSLTRPKTFGTTIHVQREGTPRTHGDAIVDIFRVADSRFVEHWDVIQPVPEAAANANTFALNPSQE
jgi:predicted SnoaL-like aldol condensation-catalyzing enzyme